MIPTYDFPLPPNTKYGRNHNVALWQRTKLLSYRFLNLYWLRKNKPEEFKGVDAIYKQLENDRAREQGTRANEDSVSISKA